MMASTTPTTRPAAAPLTFEDRRAHPRLCDNPPVLVSGIEGLVRDISQGGICLETSQSIRAAEEYTLRLFDSLGRTSQEIRAEVVWEWNGKAGLRWIDLTPEQDSWLFQRFREWLAMQDRTGANPA